MNWQNTVTKSIVVVVVNFIAVSLYLYFYLSLRFSFAVYQRPYLLPRCSISSRYLCHKTCSFLFILTLTCACLPPAFVALFLLHVHHSSYIHPLQFLRIPLLCPQLTQAEFWLLCRSVVEGKKRIRRSKKGMTKTGFTRAGGAGTNANPVFCGG